ncbi:unnamed protein product [Adineta steineri]|uniref:Uncharacterized protein n=1 Tax=Adineta steineri TaxID=433720 RepID=A0A815PZ71_9BILA|nr:unnamed protein product [Adineta steineri]
MAAATRKAPCCICGKEKGGVRCEGCSRIFCMNDFANHRQELNQQLDEVAVTRDLTQEILIDKKAEPQKNPLIGQINAWELESINIIKEAAEQARQTLFKHSTTLYTQIEDRLNKLTDQLRLAREDNDLFETDIHLWKQNLAELQSELTEPPTVRIQHGSEPLITNIIIDTLGNLGNDTSNTTIRPNASATFQHATSSDSITGYNKQITRIPADLITYSTIPNVSSSQSNSEKKITTQCLYCFEQCEIGERLLHQEICLKNPDNIAKKQWAMINTNSNSNSSSNRWNRRIEPDNNDNIPYETRQKETEWYNYNDHTEICLKNPDNIAKKQWAMINTNSNSNSSSNRWNRRIEPDNNDNIPCEIFKEEIKWCNYDNHMEACTERERERGRRQNETRAYNQGSLVRLVQCKYCNKERHEYFIATHEAVCRAAAINTTYATMFHLPSFPH